MCTCINLKTKDCYFGRNLDLDYRFGEKVVITPRNYEFKLKNGDTFKTKYAMIGMATVVGNYPLYAEASNEKGLSIAGLYFPNNAHYKEEESSKINITPTKKLPLPSEQSGYRSGSFCINQQTGTISVAFSPQKS